MLVRVCINGHPSTLWWGCKLLQPLWRTVWRFLEKLKIELPYDPTVPLLGVYPEKTIIQKDTCTHPNVHNITITIARTWKEPTCPLTDEWIKKMWPVHTHTHTHIHTHTGIPLCHNKEWNNATCSNMCGPRDYHSKYSKSKTNIIGYYLHVESEKKRYKWTYWQNRKRLTDVENKLMFTQREGGGE